jgi:hypothetical protein
MVGIDYQTPKGNIENEKKGRQREGQIYANTFF